MDLTNELRRAVSTGKVYYGVEQALKAIEKKQAKLLIVATDKKAEEPKPIAGFKRRFLYPGTNMELGAACGKPFSVSVLTIVQEGQSRVLDLAPP